MALDYSKIRRPGTTYQPAFQAPKKKRWHPNQAAKAAGAARTLSADERARWASENGFSAR